jgi:hypothetical protein
MESQQPAKLIEQALAGDDDAASQLLELQKQGQALRYYPEGRKDPEDNGVIAFGATIIVYRGATTVRMETGLSTAIVPLSREQSIKLLQALHGIKPTKQDSLLPWRDSGIKPKFLCGMVYLVMPLCAAAWDLDFQQALELESQLIAVLMEQVSGAELQSLLDEIYGDS